eukprot:c4001_g1_i4 orf=112-273(+)
MGARVGIRIGVRRRIRRIEEAIPIAWLEQQAAIQLDRTYWLGQFDQELLEGQW